MPVAGQDQHRCLRYSIATLDLAEVKVQRRGGVRLRRAEVLGLRRGAACRWSLGLMRGRHRRRDSVWRDVAATLVL